MAVLDRATRLLINNLKTRIKILTVLVVVLALALTGMTVMYFTKGEDKPADSGEISSDTANENTDSMVDEPKNENQSEDELSSDSNPSKVNSETPTSSAEASSNKASSSSKASSSNSTAANATPGSDLSSWNLKLVNAKNPLPNGYSVRTEKIKASYARDVGMLYDARAVSYLNSMCAAAEKDGVNLLVISSHRTNARQTALFNNQVNKQRNLYPNLSEDELKKKAATISAYPGTSEHELGLAVDFNSVEESFENTAQYQWLKTHAEEYGFILRYTKEKQSITGVIYEPWHYRFVGKEHAKKINQLGYCLEEYIDYLKNQGK